MGQEQGALIIAKKLSYRQNSTDILATTDVPVCERRDAYCGAGASAGASRIIFVSQRLFLGVDIFYFSINFLMSLLDLWPALGPVDGRMPLGFYANFANSS